MPRFLVVVVVVVVVVVDQSSPSVRDLRRDARGTETARAAFRFIEVFAFDNLRRHDLFENQLRDAIAHLDFKVFLAVVEKNHPNVTAVVVVDDAGADVDKLLPRQARTRSDSGVGSLGNGDGEIRLDEFLTTSRNDVIVRAALRT